MFKTKVNFDSRPIIVSFIFLSIAAGAYGAYRYQRDLNLDFPALKNLNVPFTSQAPQANWEEPWQNACEETSIIMADNFYKDRGITPKQAREQILTIFSVKEKNFGESKDESMERIAEIINAANLNWTATVSVNPLLNDIKKEIAQNHPVIVPIDAKLLKEAPYDDSFDYHVFIISGYDEEKQEFIVQDPGTKNGKNDRYGYENLYNAINDYLPGAFPSGRKAVLFTSPK